MDLIYYNNEIEKILRDMDNLEQIEYDQLSEIIDMISITIHQYSDEKLKNIKKNVRTVLLIKYKPYFKYDLDSALNLKEVQKIEILHANDLISHRYDYDGQVYQENKYINRKKRISEIKKIPQHEQKSKEWLAQRQECLTATAIAIALDEDPYKYPIELLLDKCGKGIPFEENENVHHGKKYEEIANMYYAYRNNVKVAEYGLIQSDTHSFIGASPDGICEENTLHNNKLTKLVGRLLEIKCPKKRKILTEGELNGDICPHYYYVQVQTQLFVTKMEECDFLQCQIEEYDNWDDFVEDSLPGLPGLSKKTNLEKGCIIQLLPKNLINNKNDNMCLYNAKYIYPPKLHMTYDEIKKWISEEIINYPNHLLNSDYVIDRIIYWRFEKISCNLIKYKKEWFESKISKLKQFWKYVLFYRENEKKLDKLVEFVQEFGIKDSKKIFSKINRDYIAVNTKSNYSPLYQKETAWRKKYNQKYSQRGISNNQLINMVDFN